MKRIDQPCGLTREGFACEVCETLDALEIVELTLGESHSRTLAICGR